MKKIFSILFVLTLAFAFIFPRQALAQTRNYNPNQIVVLPKTQVVNHDYFGAGNSVTLSGTVNGAAYLAGNNITVNGNVTDDIIAAGSIIDIKGTVGHNLRIIGGQVTIDGDIKGSVTVAGGMVTITENAKIAGSLMAASGNITILGPIAKQAYLAANKILIGSTIGSDVRAAGNIELISGAKIAGTLTYESTTPALIDSGATVSGKISQIIPAKPAPTAPVKPAKFIIPVIGFFALVKFIMELLLGIIFILLAPNYTARVAKQISENGWTNFGIGLLSVIALPVLILVSMATIIGIPLGLILIFAFGILGFLANIMIAAYIGSWILQRSTGGKAGIIWSFILGLIIFDLVKIIPIAGMIIGALAYLIGFGALIIVKNQLYLDLKQKKII